MQRVFLTLTKAKQRNTSLVVLQLPAGVWLWSSLISGTDSEKTGRHKTFSYSIKDLSSPWEIHILPWTAQTPIHEHKCQRTAQNRRIQLWHLVSGMAQDFLSLGVNFMGLLRAPVFFPCCSIPSSVRSFKRKKAECNRKPGYPSCCLCFVFPFLSAVLD